jgi:glycerate dehydrogenase
MQGVFLDFGTVSNGDLDTRALYECLPGLVIHEQTPEDQIALRIAGCEVVLLNKCRLTHRTIAANPQLRLVAVTATGVDNIDLEAARAAGVAVCNLRDYCSPSVAQHVFALMLALNQHLPDYDRFARQGLWGQQKQFSAFPFPVHELRGRQLGIIGLGKLGAEVARIAGAFGMKVLVANRPQGTAVAGRLDLQQLLPQVDVLSLHCPLCSTTRGLIGQRELALMKSDAILINTARGGLVDAQALADALREGRLGGAGIDVLESEPPTHGNPLLDPGIPNLIVTPHIAWAAREARQRCIDELAANVGAFLAGERRHRLD